MGALRRFWRQMSLKLGSRMVTWTVVHLRACLRRRTATSSDSSVTAVRSSVHPSRFRGKVRPLPTDLGPGCSRAGITGECSAPEA